MYRMDTFTVFYDQVNHASAAEPVVYEHNLETRTGIPGGLVQDIGAKGRQLPVLIPLNEEGKECRIDTFDGDSVTVVRNPVLPDPAAYRLTVQAVHSINQ
jgi:hypothetical protein